MKSGKPYYETSFLKFAMLDTTIMGGSQLYETEDPGLPQRLRAIPG